MNVVTVERAVRDAAVVELSAARFYRRLAGLTDDPEAIRFCTAMAEQKLHHASLIRRRGLEVLGASTLGLPSPWAHTIETAPGWELAEGMTYLDALNVALEAERHAFLYYDTVADSLNGLAAEFFRDLSSEAAHAHAIELLLEDVTRDTTH